MSSYREWLAVAHLAFALVGVQPVRRPLRINYLFLSCARSPSQHSGTVSAAVRDSRAIGSANDLATWPQSWA